MPKRTSKKKKRKRPGDVNQLAKAIVDEATEEPELTIEPEQEKTSDGKNAAAVALGRLGGLKGGKARALKLSAEERSKIASKAAQARWRRGDGAK